MVFSRGQTAQLARLAGMQGSVTVNMKASPERIWDVITDVTRIGEFSPETLEAEWLKGATGPAVGAEFRGHVKRNGRPPMYWTVCKITTCDINREFGFSVMTGGKPVNTWTYKLAPTADGTAVTESFALTQSAPLKIYWALFGWARKNTNDRGMRTTLERIRTVVEKSD